MDATSCEDSPQEERSSGLAAVLSLCGLTELIPCFALLVCTAFALSINCLYSTHEL